MGSRAAELAAAIGAKHAHRNFSKLEQIGEDVNGDLTYKGKAIGAGPKINDTNYSPISLYSSEKIENNFAKIDSNGKVLNQIDANKIVGTIDISNMPAAAIERLVIVANQAGRFALNTIIIQNGDTVKQNDTGELYYVKDDTQLNSEAGYEPYSTGIAAACPWTGITNKPTTISGFGITDLAESVGNITFDVLKYKQAQATVQTFTSAVTITPDFNLGQMATLTLATNATLANPTNLKIGSTIQIMVKQDATGSRTLAYGTNYKFASGIAPALSTTANAVDILTLSSFDGINIYCTLIKDMK